MPFQYQFFFSKKKRKYIKRNMYSPDHGLKSCKESFVSLEIFWKIDICLFLFDRAKVKKKVQIIRYWTLHINILPCAAKVFISHRTEQTVVCFFFVYHAMEILKNNCFVCSYRVKIRVEKENVRPFSITHPQFVWNILIFGIFDEDRFYSWYFYPFIYFSSQQHSCL